uniref:Uncharacterized protein n=1 Tax=Arundo donax TaxID=35708 RepID=A0A0A9B372_ARUDO
MVSRSREHYVKMCYYLTGLKYSSAEDLAILLWRYGDAWNSAGSEFRRSLISFAEDRRDSFRKNAQLVNGARLGAILIGKDQLVGSTTSDMLELIAEVWAELLFCVAGECDSNDHAKQLSHGGELITIARFLVLYLSNGMVNERFSGSI